MTEYKEITTDVLVIGGGAAGARAAIEARGRGVNVVLVDKGRFSKSGSSAICIGGIAAPTLHPKDSLEVYFRDIIVGGEYINDQELVNILVSKAKESVLSLEDYGVLFAREADGVTYKLGQSGGHTYPRILYEFYPDRFGVALMRALSREAKDRGVVVFEETYIVDLIKGSNGIAGALGIHMPTGTIHVFRAKAVVLATGGAGQLNGWDSVSAITTNPIQVTGDGHALAYRVGAMLQDMEFIQYMPMTFVYPRILHGVGIGEPGFESIVLKAKLYNAKGERFMKRYEPQVLEATTRDKLARAIYTEIIEGRGTEHGGVYYDYTANPDYPKERPYRYHLFVRYCGIDPTKEWVEGAPGWHYFMGGVKIDKNASTNVPGLFAVGEVTGGIHGGNRLGGNSLTDTQVFGVIAGVSAAKYARSKKGVEDIDVYQVKSLIEKIDSLIDSGGDLRPYAIQHRIQEIVYENIGVIRDGKTLSEAVAKLEHINQNEIPKLNVQMSGKRYNTELIAALETMNMGLVALLIARSALLRTESRGAHYRKDHPKRDDKRWLKNILVQDAKGEMKFTVKDAKIVSLYPEE